jgi:hypothetical protein
MPIMAARPTCGTVQNRSIRYLRRQLIATTGIYGISMAGWAATSGVMSPHHAAHEMGFSQI